MRGELTKCSTKDSRLTFKLVIPYGPRMTSPGAEQPQPATRALGSRSRAGSGGKQAPAQPASRDATHGLTRPVSGRHGLQVVQATQVVAQHGPLGGGCPVIISPGTPRTSSFHHNQNRGDPRRHSAVSLQNPARSLHTAPSSVKPAGPTSADGGREGNLSAKADPESWGPNAMCSEPPSTQGLSGFLADGKGWVWQD